MSAPEQAPAADGQAAVIARAVFQHHANRTGDPDTMRAAALILRQTDPKPSPRAEENPR